MFDILAALYWRFILVDHVSLYQVGHLKVSINYFLGSIICQ